MNPKYHSKLVALNQIPRKANATLKKALFNDLVGDFGGGAMENEAMKMLSQMMGVETKPGNPGQTPEQSAEHALEFFPISYAKVLQANPVLYDIETAQHAPAVLICINDLKDALDIGKLDQILAKIEELRDSGETTSEEEEQLLAVLDDPDSTFKVQVPTSLTNGISVSVWDQILDPQILTEGYLTDDTVLPGLSVFLMGRHDFYFLQKDALDSL